MNMLLQLDLPSLGLAFVIYTILIGMFVWFPFRCACGKHGVPFDKCFMTNSIVTFVIIAFLSLNGAPIAVALLLIAGIFFALSLISLIYKAAPFREKNPNASPFHKKTPSPKIVSFDYYDCAKNMSPLSNVMDGSDLIQFQNTILQTPPIIVDNFMLDINGDIRNVDLSSYKLKWFRGAPARFIDHFITNSIMTRQDIFGDISIPGLMYFYQHMLNVIYGFDTEMTNLVFREPSLKELILFGLVDPKLSTPHLTKKGYYFRELVLETHPSFSPLVRILKTRSHPDFTMLTHKGLKNLWGAKEIKMFIKGQRTH
jgi:hypothetical protein